MVRTRSKPPVRSAARSEPTNPIVAHAATILAHLYMASDLLQAETCTLANKGVARNNILEMIQLIQRDVNPASVPPPPPMLLASTSSAPTQVF